MSLFKREQEENKNENENKDTNNDNAVTQQQDNTSTDTSKAKFTMYLFMKEHCPVPQPELITQVFNKHIENSRLDTYHEVYFEVAANSYQFEITDELFCPHLFVTDCKPLGNWTMDDVTRGQLRNQNTMQLVDDCKYHVTALAGLCNYITDYKQRATLLTDYIETLMELYPTCEAVMFESSGKIVTRDFIINQQCSKEEKFIKYLVNIRIFQITNTDEILVDSIGMHVVSMPDIQYRFKGLDPNLVMAHACFTLEYMFANNMPIRNGDTVDSITSDELFCQELQWKCRYQISLIKPERPIIDIDTSEYIPLNPN